VTLSLTGEYTGLNNASNLVSTAYNATINYFLLNPWGYWTKASQSDLEGDWGGELEWVWNEQAVSVETVSEDPLVVRYRIQENSLWSDGVPVSGADLLLSWAGASLALNDPAVDSGDSEGRVSIPADQRIYFDGGDGISSAITMVPKVNPDDFRDITVSWSKPSPDWQFAFANSGVPAHKVGQLALGIEDPRAAAEYVAELIVNHSRGDSSDRRRVDLAKVANFWSTAYEFNFFPSETGLLVVNGAFEIESIAVGEYISLRRRADFSAGPSPLIDRVIFRYIPDANAQLQALQNGEIDIMVPDNVTLDVLETLQNLPDVQLKYFTNGTYEHLDLLSDPQAKDSPFSAAHYAGDAERARLVRTAFLKALPRESLVDALIRPVDPTASVRNSFTAMPGSEFYSQIVLANASAEFPGGDSAAALKLLAEAGFPDALANPIEVSLVYNRSKPIRVQQFQLIAEAMLSAGFRVVDAGVEPTAVGAAYWSGAYDILMFASMLNQPTFSGSAANYVTGGANNRTGFSNQRVDELWQQIISDPDILQSPSSQAQLVAEAEQLLWQDGFGAPLFQFPGLLAVTSRVRGVDAIPVWSLSVYNFWEWEVIN
jgi:peptide/nickel transport system substrate-binding protein